MLLGVVSDSHGQVELTRAAARMLESLAPEVVLHCGDIGSVEVVELLRRWPTHYVFGNCDRDEDWLRRGILAAGQTCHGRFGDLTLAGRRIALLHSDNALVFNAAIHSGDYDLVCYGHTHQAEHHLEGKTLVLNPGAIYRATPHSIAVVDLATMTPTIVPL